MLQQVLSELQSAQGTLALNDLGKRLGVEPGALAGMLEFWIRKGKLRLEGAEMGETECAGACSTTCPGPADCGLLMQMPKMYEVVFSLEE